MGAEAALGDLLRAARRDVESIQVNGAERAVSSARSVGDLEPRTDVALVHDRAASGAYAVLEAVGRASCRQDADSADVTRVRVERLLRRRLSRHGRELTVGCPWLVFGEVDPVAGTKIEEASSSFPERCRPDPGPSG
ncbi:hypothetical protein ACI79D_03020 [Geodermatophilus sp. SYSU D00708]